MFDTVVIICVRKVINLHRNEIAQKSVASERVVI